MRGPSRSYNRGMRQKLPLTPPIGACLVVGLLLAPTLPAQAQGSVLATPTGVKPADPLTGPQNQKIERIRHEDAGSRIDEVRYGGQTESITVQPKSGMPAYQVDTGARSRAMPADRREELGATGGQRSWNLLKF